MERMRSKIVGGIFGQMPEIFGRIGIGNFLTFSINEGVFGKSKDRFGTISGRNKKSMIVRSRKVSVPFVSFLSIIDSTRTSVIKPGPFSFRKRESTWNVCLHPRDDHLCNAMGPHRGVPCQSNMSVFNYSMCNSLSLLLLYQRFSLLGLSLPQLNINLPTRIFIRQAHFTSLATGGGFLLITLFC